MTTSSKIHQVRLNDWAVRISEQKASGLSVNDWCIENGVSRNQFFYWKRLLKASAFNAALPDIVSVALPATNDYAPPSASAASDPGVSSVVSNFEGIGFTSCTSCKTCMTGARIVTGGLTIEISNAVSGDFLSSLIKAVRNA